MPPPITAQLSVAVKARERYFQRVQQAYDLLNKQGKEDDFLVRIDSLEDTYDKFEAVCDQINLLSALLEDKSEAVDTAAESKAFNELFYKVKAYAAKLSAKKAEAQASNVLSETLINNAGPSINTPKAKLPTINIPIFDGDVTCFPSWLSLYNELVHTSDHLSDIQKFSYLKSYLKGSALGCVETISFSAANYPLAYKSLQDRYGRKRTLASTLTNKLLDFKPLQRDSVGDLQSFLDGFYVVVESLRSLAIANLDEFLLLHIGMRILDNHTVMEFEKEMIKTEFPTFKDLVLFVRNKTQVLLQTSESCSLPSTSHGFPSHSSGQNRIPRNFPKQKVMIMKTETKRCYVCSEGPHKLSMCPKFQRMDPGKRFTVVKDMKLCFSCLSATHSASQCESVYRCRTCQSSKHHSLLHKEQPGPASTSHVVTGAAKACDNQSHTVLLGTASVQIQTGLGEWVTTRCVIDAGSQVSIISENLVQTLKLQRQFCNIQISGIGSNAPLKTRGQVNVHILPHNDNNKLKSMPSPLMVQAVIMPKIMANLPSKIPASSLKKFAHLRLADTTYLDESKNQNIDILLGAEYYEDIMLTESPMIKGAPTAVPSIFGYLLLGRLNENSSLPSSCTSLFISKMEDSLSTQLQKFWTLEEVETVIPSNKEDQECEDLFLSTHLRDKDGRYQVKLPFIKGASPLGSNREKAIKSYRSMEHRLNMKDPDMKILYHDNLQSYLEMDHMELAKKPADYLLIHHGVYRENSETTKLRVVFSPNVVSTTGQTLSNVLCVGPKLQLNIQDLLIQFRLNPVALTCDIQAMYRNILVDPKDRKFQHIVWRAESSKNIQEYELKTVTFGLPPSPYLAQRVIKQLALDEQKRFPNASKVLLESIYVDDIVTGSDTVLSAQNLRDELISLLQAGGFSLRKWTTSHTEVLSDFSSNTTPHLLGSSESVKVLGIKWCPKTDSFKYSVSVNSNMNITKRSVLSCIATIYDVNGFLSPVIIYMKIFLQKLWLNKEDSWDTPLPKDLHTQWCKLLTELPLLDQVQIPRYILDTEYVSVQLIGFADASIQAYAAVLYLRVVSTSGVHVRLLRGKTKVAPLKVQSINRLELNGCFILSQLVKSIAFLIQKLSITQIYLFSDSKTALSWLRIQPHLLKTYVANRVVQILEWTTPSQWHHVSSEFNSADPASRGLTPSQLVDNKLWFNGPDFLLLDPQNWPSATLETHTEPLPELKTSEVVSLLIQPTHISDFIHVINQYSSLIKLQRVMGWVLRFVNNLKQPDKRCLADNLTVQELRQSLEKCLWISQVTHFSADLEAIQKGQLSKTLRSLSPILNSVGVLVVGGRLDKAPLPEHSKHPCILAPKCNLTKLLINHYHQMTLHGGPLIVQSLLQRRYWIVNARNVIRSVIFHCVPCTKMRAQTLQPMMADLPRSRFSQGRPFINVGVDFAGPFSYKTGPRRNSPIDKCYLALFVCLATKCIHLEIVSSLSTPAFIAALDRFVGRRGLPEGISSDNGTNFRGAATYLSEVQVFLNKNNQIISNHLLKKEVTWSFIPPSAPNFGGLWEAGVKSAKGHLKHVLNCHTLNFEEYSTLAVNVEAILNSRPLCALSSDPGEKIDYLTPGHFLIGAPLIERPERDMSEVYISPLKRWNLITKATQSFWKRWSQDYLHTLIQRSKWTKPSSNIKLNDVVLIHGQQQATQCWPVGIVVGINPGSDGIVRVATVRTAHGEFKRPVSKLILLPVTD